MNEKTLNEPSETNWTKLAALTDEEIDTSDIAPLDESFFADAELRMPRGKNKVIEIEKLKDSNGKEFYILLVDGKTLNGVSVTYYGDEFYKRNDKETRKRTAYRKGRYAIIARKNESFDILTSYCIEDFQPLALLVTVEQSSELIENAVVDKITIQYLEEDYFVLQISLYIDFYEWTKPYSFRQFLDELTRISEPISVEDDGGVNFEIPIQNLKLPIREEINRCLKIISQLYERANQELIELASKNSVSLSFDFPEEVKIPCEQYLVYFIQFLSDLGVEANYEIKDQLEKVLFTVTPKDEFEALDKIRAALEIYLRLPFSPISNSSLQIENEIAVQRLFAEIEHCRSSLRLAYAELQIKEANIQIKDKFINAQQNLIERQRTTIEQQKKILSGEIIIDSIVDVSPRNESQNEEFLEGLVKVKSFEWEFLEFDIPKLIKKLREWMKKDKNT